MRVDIDQKKWLGRQSFLVQAAVLCAIFFIVNAGVSILFDGTEVLNGTNKEILKYFSVKLVNPLIWGIVLALMIRGNRKKNQNKNAH